MPVRSQTFDSNGPDVRIRGNAYQVLEKYLALARARFEAERAQDRLDRIRLTDSDLENGHAIRGQQPIDIGRERTIGL